jgi:hypothetical protein
VALALPMVLVAPTLLALSWQISLIGTRSLGDPISATGTLHLVGWLTSAGAVCGVAVTAFLAVFHRPANRGAPWLAALVVAGLLVSGVVAMALQTFALPLVLTRGGPIRSTQTPLYQIYDFGVFRLELGPATANATILLAVLAMLGLGAWLLMFLTRLRVQMPARATNPDRATSAGWAVAGAIILIVVLGVVAYGLWPWLNHSVGGVSRVRGGTTALRLFVDTWLPPLPSTVVGVGVAALGGFGIGALRPLGRYSELLLLPFAPWLFVGLGPLALANFVSVRDSGQLNTFLGLIPRVWVVVPALFLFTVLFRGLAEQANGRWSDTLLPALPMLFVVAGATWLLYAQDITWTLLTAQGPGTATGPVYGLNIAGEYAASTPAPNTAYPQILVLLFAAGLAVAQVLYLDRLSIHIGRQRPELPPVIHPRAATALPLARHPS